MAYTACIRNTCYDCSGREVWGTPPRPPGPRMTLPTYLYPQPHHSESGQTTTLQIPAAQKDGRGEWIPNRGAISWLRSLGWRQASQALKPPDCRRKGHHVLGAGRFLNCTCTAASSPRSTSWGPTVHGTGSGPEVPRCCFSMRQAVSLIVCRTQSAPNMRVWPWEAVASSLRREHCTHFLWTMIHTTQ